MFQVLGQRFPCSQPIEKTTVTRVVPLSLMEDHARADIHTTACGVPCAGAGGYALKEVVTPWRACAGAGFWEELQLVEKSPRRSR